ncbi:MAG: hypothetical protein ACTJHU_07995, partial [Mycetocola sp.]
ILSGILAVPTGSAFTIAALAGVLVATLGGAQTTQFVLRHASKTSRPLAGAPEQQHKPEVTSQQHSHSHDAQPNAFSDDGDPSPTTAEQQTIDNDELLRGGKTIGYLERGLSALALVSGALTAVAIIIAIKGLGRFTELDSSAARERFIIGTLASLAWATLAITPALLLT